MLINLSNHPSQYWSEQQLALACERWERVVDMPFPAIVPTSDTMAVQQLAAEYCERCVEMLGDTTEASAVHLMGEMVFCYNLVTMLKAAGISVVASTAERSVRYVGDIKETIFVFVTFREY